MKTIKIIIFVALIVICGFNISRLYAQTDPCTPVSLSPSCDTCACAEGLRAGCTEKKYWLEVYTTGSNCHATVAFRIKKCDTLCYPGYCQVIIDTITPLITDCAECDISDSVALQDAMEQIQAYILSHLYSGCDGLDPGNAYDYIISKPACWKKVVTSLGGGLFKTTFEPCNRTYCCVSSYCAYWDDDGTYFIAQIGPTACPTPVDCTTGCYGGMDICFP